MTELRDTLLAWFTKTLTVHTEQITSLWTGTDLHGTKGANEMCLKTAVNGALRQLLPEYEHKLEHKLKVDGMTPILWSTVSKLILYPDTTKAPSSCPDIIRYAVTHIDSERYILGRYLDLFLTLRMPHPGHGRSTMELHDTFCLGIELKYLRTGFILEVSNYFKTEAGPMLATMKHSPAQQERFNCQVLTNFANQYDNLSITDLGALPIKLFDNSESTVLQVLKQAKDQLSHYLNSIPIANRHQVKQEFTPQQCYGLVLVGVARRVVYHHYKL